MSLDNFAINEVTEATPPAHIIAEDDHAWHSLADAGYPGTRMKMLSVDDEHKAVHFLFAMDPGALFPRHRHVCRAVVYTLEGSWDYEEGHMEKGSLVIEPPGSYHTPTTQTGCVLLTHLLSDCKDMLLVDMNEDGTETAMLDLDFYRQYL